MLFADFVFNSWILFVFSVSESLSASFAVFDYDIYTISARLYLCAYMIDMIDTPLEPTDRPTYRQTERPTEWLSDMIMTKMNQTLKGLLWQIMEK